MLENSPAGLTQLLRAWSDGDETALQKLTPLVYEELHRLAHRYMAHEQRGHTLQTSALLNEAYIRLIGGRSVQWQNRAHFFAVSAQIMRRILVDFARSKRNLKRGGGAQHITLDEALLVSPDAGNDLLALDDALTRLARLNQRQSQIVELRYFGDLKETEIAEVLKISTRTVRNDWSLARAWLYRELKQDGVNDS